MEDGFSFLDLDGLQPGRVNLGEESVGSSYADVQSPNPVMVLRRCRRLEIRKTPISDNCTSHLMICLNGAISFYREHNVKKLGVDTTGNEALSGRL